MRESGSAGLRGQLVFVDQPAETVSAAQAPQVNHLGGRLTAIVRWWAGCAVAVARAPGAAGARCCAPYTRVALRRGGGGRESGSGRDTHGGLSRPSARRGRAPSAPAPAT